MILILFVLWFLLESVIYRDFLATSDYGVWLITGKMGSGKTTLEQRFACEYGLRGWHLFSNFKMSGCSLVNNDDFFSFKYPRNSLILLDEAGVFWNSRDWKEFPAGFVVFLKNARKDGLKIIFLSQSADIDKTIRLLCDRVYLLKKIWLFSLARAITVEPALLNNGSVSENKTGTEFGDVYKYVPITIKGAWLFTWLPRYAGLFDSFEAIINDREPFPVSSSVDVSRLSRKWYRRYKWSFWCSSISSLFKFRGRSSSSDVVEDDSEDDDASSLFVLGDSEDD